MVDDKFNVRLIGIFKVLQDPSIDRSSEWKLFDRKEVTYKGKKYFYEKWFHPPSNSGIVIYKDIYSKDDEIIYVVEGYGVGTINSEFKEIGKSAPIQKRTFKTERSARKFLKTLMNTNIYFFKTRKHSFSRSSSELLEVGNKQ